MWAYEFLFFLTQLFVCNYGSWCDQITSACSINSSCVVLNVHLWFLLQKRQILVTIIEICLPLLFAAILIALRHRVHAVNQPNATIYHNLPVDKLPKFFYNWHRGNLWELAYVPSNNTAVTKIAKAVQRALHISKGQNVSQFVRS